MRMGLCMYVITPLVIVRFLYSEMTSVYMYVTFSISVFVFVHIIPVNVYNYDHFV